MERTASTQAAPATARAAGAPWLVAPAVDLLVIANLAWPLVALLGGLAWTSGTMTFLQLYVISSAHRWITVPLVVMDKRWFPGQTKRFTGVAAAITLLWAAVIGLAIVVPPATGPNLLLYGLIVDYVWNAWHFASQHAGIYRIYGRKVEGKTDDVAAEREKSLIRVMVLWVLLRNVLTLALGAGTLPAGLEYARYLDPFVFLGPLWLLWREVRLGDPARLPRLAYLGSVTALYAAITATMWGGPLQVRVGILLAHALFHAIEYIAVCGWVGQKKQGGAWTYVAPRITTMILGFCLVVGVANWLVLNLWSLQAWAIITLWASYLHYAWDGMIWKAPKPALAR